MTYIPFQYDALMQTVILLFGCLVAVVLMADARRRGASAAVIKRRLAGIAVGVLIALAAYAFQVLLRQAHENAESVRQHRKARKLLYPTEAK